MRGPRSTCLGLCTPGPRQTGFRPAHVPRVFLQLALAGLIANRAVERVIDEQRFEHRLAHLLRRGRSRINLHAGRDRRGASDRPARCAGFVRQRLAHNLWRAIFVEDRVAIRAHGGKAELDQAHAAIAGDGQFRMIAVVRDLHTGQCARLKHGCRLEFALPIRHQLGHLNFPTVHHDLIFSTGGGAGLSWSSRQWASQIFPSSQLPSLSAAAWRASSPRLWPIHL